MSKNYDAAKYPCDPEYTTYRTFLEDSESNFIGPGGKRTNVENNEKGILETNLFGVIALHCEADLGSDHDPHRQGIYATNSVGDND
jgi:hypothetical protein